jgi:hypothetical protein
MKRLWTWLSRLLQRRNTVSDEPSPTPQQIALIRAAYPAGSRAPAEAQLFVMFQFGDQHGFERGRAEGLVEGARSLLYKAPLVRQATGEIAVEIDHIGKRQMYHPPQNEPSPATYSPPEKQTGPMQARRPGIRAEAVYHELQEHPGTLARHHTSALQQKVARTDGPQTSELPRMPRAREGWYSDESGTAVGKSGGGGSPHSQGKGASMPKPRLTRVLDPIPDPNDTGYSIPAWLGDKQSK